MPKIIEPRIELPRFKSQRILQSIENKARVCYKSEYLESKSRTGELIKRLLSATPSHESVIEHETLSVKFTVDRGVSHELVRHRLSSFSQESTRYCAYDHKRFGNQITVIRPYNLTTKQMHEWEQAMCAAEQAYFSLIAAGCTAEMARSVLPNSLKTEVWMSANMREWRHVLRLRTTRAAHPQIRQVMIPLLIYLQERLEPLFFDISLPDDHKTILSSGVQTDFSQSDDRWALDELYGVGEIAQLLGWTSGMVSTYVSRGVLPEPAHKLAMGSLWTAEQIEQILKDNTKE